MYDETSDDSGRSGGPANTVRGPDVRNVAPLKEEPAHLQEVLSTIRRRWWFVLLVALLFTGAAVGFDLWRTPVYEASAKLLVDYEPERPDQQVGLPSSDVLNLQQATRTMAEAVNSRPVAGEVIEIHGLQTTPETLLENLSVEQIKDTQFVQLIYRDADPARARDVANSLGVVTSGRISEAGGASAGSMKVAVWEYAEVPQTPVSPDPFRDGLLAAAMGILFGVGLVLLLEARGAKATK